MRSLALPKSQLERALFANVSWHELWKSEGANVVIMTTRWVFTQRLTKRRTGLCSVDLWRSPERTTPTAMGVKTRSQDRVPADGLSPAENPETDTSHRTAAPSTTGARRTSSPTSGGLMLLLTQLMGSYLKHELSHFRHLGMLLKTRHGGKQPLYCKDHSHWSH